MLITVQNEKLQLTVDTLGAQMMSLIADGIEYLWQGDPKYWADRAPTLFPFIGRLTDNTCKVHGKVYPMGLHGFARNMEFSLVEQTENSVTLSLGSNAQTKAQFPFDFRFQVVYRLEGDRLDIRSIVENLSGETMPFALGGHPGFNVPLTKGEKFEDYVLEFTQECLPDKICFTPTVYLNGQEVVYPLEGGKRIPLRHDLFDDDAVVLKNADREVTLRSTVSGKGVRVAYPDLPYIGFWHLPKSDAPYVCIEPWSSLPSRQDVVEELTCKSDLIRVETGKNWDSTWSITVF